MSHDPEVLAAAYLDGLPAGERRLYEDHLLSCERCWMEVSLARKGRLLAESIRDVRPSDIREDIRAAVAAAAAAAAAEQRPGAPTHQRRRRLTILVAALVTTLALSGGALLWRPWHHNSPVTAAAQSTILAAVASFRGDRLPGTLVPAQPAPDLNRLGLQLVGAAAGNLDGVDVSAYSYRTGAGVRIDVYRSAQPIPETDGAQELNGNEDAWRTDVSGITVICGPATHTMLLIGSDPVLVRHVGELLAVV